MLAASKPTSPSWDHIYLVDDDEGQRMFIQRLCNSAGLQVTAFSMPTEFLAAGTTITAGCLLVDMMMPGMDGLELFGEIARLQMPLTCVLMTGFADTASCRAAFRAGMFDFVAKDCSPQEIVETIKRAIHHRQSLSQCAESNANFVQQWDGLTERETEVAEELIEGHSLKKIAARLDISVQTASKHRCRIFEKVGVGSEVELLKTTMTSRQAG